MIFEDCFRTKRFPEFDPFTRFFFDFVILYILIKAIYIGNLKAVSAAAF